MLTPGIYKGRVKEWGFSESRNGTPCFEVSVRLHAAENSEGDLIELDQPVSRTCRLWLSPAAMSMTAANLRSLGYADPDLSRLDPDHEDFFDLHNVEAFVEVSHETYNGRDVEKVELRRGRSSPKKKPADLKAFAEAQAAFAEQQQKEADRNSEAEEAAPAPRRRRKQQA